MRAILFFIILGIFSAQGVSAYPQGSAGSVKNRGGDAVRIRVEDGNGDYQWVTLPPRVTYDLPEGTRALAVYPHVKAAKGTGEPVSVSLWRPNGDRVEIKKFAHRHEW
ncbi:MAG: hypothetical protein Q8R76_07540 [Candidatus Omnitrophota bacterium]|nr:hypothetical protein [Candidatus Omnitrophota bacterium]